MQMVELDIGYVGEVTRVDPTILNVLGDDGYIPVVATIATDPTGQALNINADTAAGEVSEAALGWQRSMHASRQARTHACMPVAHSTQSAARAAAWLPLHADNRAPSCGCVLGSLAQWESQAGL